VISGVRSFAARARNFVLLLLLGVAVPVAAQTSAPEVNPSGPVSNGPADPSPRSSQTSPQNSSPASQETPVPLKAIVPDILRDQKRVWLYPVRVVKGEHWKPTLGVVVGTAGLVALDPHDTPYFRRTTAFANFNTVASGRNAALGILAVPLSFYVVGAVRKDTYARNTALLAAEAVADSQIVTFVMKNIDRRIRPVDVPPGGDFAHTWFKSRGSFISGGQSFPSGHTAAAFSLATVLAERYRRHVWVPWVAYGLAGTVGFSRLTLQAHFPSDVFAGAILGIALSHYIVLRHR